MLKKDLSLLISINDDIASIKDNKKLVDAIFEKLYLYFDMKIGGVILFDKDKENLDLIIGKITNFQNFDYQIFIADTIPLSSIHVSSSPLNQRITIIDPNLIDDIKPEDFDGNSIKNTMEIFGIKSLLLIPMNVSGDLLGYMIYPWHENKINESDGDYLSKVANLIGTAINNSRAYEELQRREVEKEIQLHLLFSLAIEKNKERLSEKFVTEITSAIPSHYLSLFIKESGKIKYVYSTLKERNGILKNVSPTVNLTSTYQMLSDNISLKNFNNYYEFYDSNFEALCENSDHFHNLKSKCNINSLLIIKTSTNIGELNLVFGRTSKVPQTNLVTQLKFLTLLEKESYFFKEEVELAQQILPQIGLLLSNAIAFEEINFLTKKLEQERSYLLDEINLTHQVQEIVGTSPAIQKMLNKVNQVAPLEATVLIQGETGTGKELVAKAIHKLSARKEKTFITVNCAALPAQLIESELFGHEKGSFTGAYERRIGKFEVASGGTIFLDEIGELPLELQAKLLRVLQEKEFERLGGKSTISSDVRIISATNRDLEKEVEAGKFRADLYFRLNVFPIIVPPLRERIDDIPLLIKHFIEKYNKFVGKEVKSIKKKDLDQLLEYYWPGNVRELEHMVERATIISEGKNLNIEGFSTISNEEPEKESKSFKSLEDNERAHIMNALRMAKGKVTGENSAAELLGINGKTLGSKMRKLGIKREIIIK